MLRGALLPATLLVLLGLWLFDPNTLTEATERVEQPAVERFSLGQLTVVDGDTVRLSGQSIRLVGLDTPESYRARCNNESTLGNAATKRLRDLLARASTIELVYLQRQDRYGRYLARLMLDGRDVADIMVEEGFARRYSGGQRRSWC
ncbi:MAG: thermonuclease family protein [Pseudomonadota bacterium]